MKKTITRDNLKRLISGLLKGHRVIAPVSTGRDVVFDYVETPDEVVLDYTNTVKPPKEFFLGQKEALINYERIPAAVVSLGERVLFGIRPCDLSAICSMDNTFKEGVIDTHYFMKRASTLIIALGCSRLCNENAFCESMKAGPTATVGFDLQLLETGGNSYLVETGSEKGESIIKENPALFSEAKKASKKELKFKNFIQPDKFMKKLEVKFNDEELWRDASKTCLRCGACNYLCPSCFCYNMVDEGKERLRCWDSCMLRGFTREASGSIPRNELYTRFRQRIYHKYKWHKERYNVNMCTGCGRCVTYCPGLVPYIEVINRITKDEKPVPAKKS